MATKLNLIKEAQTTSIQVDGALATFTEMAAQSGIAVTTLLEDVTAVLANIAARSQEQGNIKVLNPTNLAPFLAGVDFVTQQLASQPNPTATLRSLAAINVGPDEIISTATEGPVQLVTLGKKSPTLNNWTQLVNAYLTAQPQQRAQAGQALAQAVNKMKMSLQNVAAKTKQPPANPNQPKFGVK
jgi:hypothetical protein